VATARGIRGLCEMRGAGLPVPLTDESPAVHEADLGETLGRNWLARAVASTATLGQAEQHSRDVCGYSEIDYERDKTTRLGTRPVRKLNPEAALHRLGRFESEARSRGITHTIFRRITEVLGFDGTQRQSLRALLISSRPEQYAAPLWRIRAETGVAAGPAALSRAGAPNGGSGVSPA
jgi:hypothetical protein